MSTTATFNCNYNCNDDCNFCFNKELLNRTPLMTLDETRENYEHIMKRFDIRNIIISGGEPSLHPDFWRLMVFFYYKIDHSIRPALNTNGILFSNTKLTEKLAKLIRLSPLPRKQISLSFSNIAHPYHPKDKKEQMKIT
jgi:MoaA/NifB/PqqE/SkfB family radical SAM enzyme